MAKIYQLPPEEIHKIAAGEVVERPANIAKELIENALDAGATHITLFVEEGGKKLLRVVDNGCGMSHEDARMSIVHHATSKIRSVHDLNSLITFGFRGEALSSISSVSRMKLVTKEEEALEGYKLLIEDGKVKEEGYVATTTGTDISIADIFYNVPARRKFLKTDETEWRAIHNVVHAFALAYPTHGFTLYHNNKLIIKCQPAEEYYDRLRLLYDKYFVSAALTCSSSFIDLKNTAALMGLTCEGIITSPQYIRYDRSSIYIFVNKRWVKNPKLTQALIKGYANVLPAGRYPAAVLNITCDPENVDINIHPRKEEVQFLHQRAIEQALEQMVRKTLETHTTTSTQLTNNQLLTNQVAYAPNNLDLVKNTAFQAAYKAPSLSEPFTSRLNSAEMPDKHSVAHFSAVLEKVFALEPLPEPTDLQKTSETQAFEAPLKQMPLEEIDQESSLKTAENIASETQAYKLIGNYKNTYILIENQEGLVLIDQHAAHERILYEQFASRFHEVAVSTLIAPVIISVTKQEIELIEQHANLFLAYGIALEPVGPGQYALKTAPVMIKHKDLTDTIKQLLAEIQDCVEPDNSLFEKALHHAVRAQMACKAAVKAGDVLTHEHMHELVTTLHKTPMRFSCPHGRPTSWTLRLFEIERSFKRKL